eukprot:s698_g11.t1
MAPLKRRKVEEAEIKESEERPEAAGRRDPGEDELGGKELEATSRTSLTTERTERQGVFELPVREPERLGVAATASGPFFTTPDLERSEDLAVDLGIGRARGKKPGEECDDWRVAGWELHDSSVTWENFFRVKGVDYKGDEVLTAQVMRWQNVAPALPQEVGTVPLDDVVDLGSRHYVQNFEDYLLDPHDQVYVKPPRVLVPPEDWFDFCSNLLRLGVFSRIHEDEVYRVSGKPLLNGLFGVSKNEFQNGIEIQRIIMNLVPCNSVCRSFDGDISTLPSWAGMTALHLEPNEELVVSSEDVRAFFYIFKIPSSWYPLLAFNRELPRELCGDRPGKYYPCSAVLPMGFRNSVSLAQHVHRYILKQALAKVGLQGGEAELRKDRPFPSANPVHRVYLDNFDELERGSPEWARTIKGKVSPLVQGLQETYANLGVPRHPKKAVARQPQAEVQGAMVDGVAGLAFPKVDKGYPPVVKFDLPGEVRQEIARFLGLIPLAYMDFRCQISPVVTASDASTTGGGITASQGLTHFGAVASACPIRGDLIEPCEITGVLTIGLFDGIGALRVAADVLGWNVVGHISVEKSAPAARVVESRFPGAILVQDVESVDLAMVQSWGQQFSQVSLVVLGAGPPCQGVSGLNAARKGALRDQRSCLFSHVARIRALVKQCFPWAQVKSLMENVASMDQADEDVMSQSFGERPWYIDAAGVSLAHRPRLYWIEWELQAAPDVQITSTPKGRPAVKLSADIDPSLFLSPGWSRVGEEHLPTFTTSRPRDSPGYKPAGLQNCREHEKTRWAADQHRFPPYQYQDKHCLRNKKQDMRVPNVQEREVIMGFPKDYTFNSVPKKDQGSQAHADTRLTLIGNSWNVTVVAWLLSQLGSLLGVNPKFTVGDIVQRTSPGCTRDLQTFLSRPPMSETHRPPDRSKEIDLVKKMLTLVSIKGEDISLQTSSEDLARYHRLRASIPARLWKWKAMASWRWTGDKEHINSLELRAVLTALRWRLERHKKAPAETQVEEMPKRHLEGKSTTERAKMRKQLGTLKSLTVQPVTRARYEQARCDFYSWLRSENLILPHTGVQLDLVLSDYLEILCAQGKGRTEGSNVLAGIQDAQPHLKGQLKQSWRLMKTWVTHEVPNRAPPLSLDCLYAMVGYSLFKAWDTFALSLLVAFHGLLRTGELLSLQARHISISKAKGPAVLSLGLTKAGKRQGAAESVTIHMEDVCRRLYHWKNSVRLSEAETNFQVPPSHAFPMAIKEALLGRENELRWLLSYVTAGENQVNVVTRGRDAHLNLGSFLFSQSVQSCLATRQLPPVIVEGEPGVGRTALLEAAAQLSEHLPGLRVVQQYGGTATELLRRLYDPWAAR